MYLEFIRVFNYRNLEAVKLQLNPGMNIFTGHNAQGKTNLLEAAVILSDGKSFRGAKTQEMITHGKQDAVVEGFLKCINRELELKFYIGTEGKKFYISNQQISDFKDYAGSLSFVVFSAESMGITSGEPKFRRNFLDRGIFNLYPHFLALSKDYRRILKQRNMTLKSKTKDEDLIKIWTEKLIYTGAKITEYRLRFLKLILPETQNFHQKLSNSLETLEMKYESNYWKAGDTFHDIETQFRDKLKQSFQWEIERGQTLHGPHRDDLKISVNGKDIRLYGSRGQKRTCVMALKLSELFLFNQLKNDFPIMVLDDFASELDLQRQHCFLKMIPDRVQTLISLTDISSDYDCYKADIFYFREGNVSRQSMAQ